MMAAKKKPSSEGGLFNPLNLKIAGCLRVMAASCRQMRFQAQNSEEPKRHQVIR
jgi:hypothetical protein